MKMVKPSSPSILPAIGIPSGEHAGNGNGNGNGKHVQQPVLPGADRWLALGSAHVSDALRVCGRYFQALDGGIRPVAARMRVAGPAFTVRCYPGATWALEEALELAPPGSILAVDGGGGADLILMGGLMSTRAKVRGIAGAVLDAAVRDIDEITALDFPVFSRHVAPRAGTFAKIGEWQTIVCLGRIPVRPGDIIVGDRDGVVVVPFEIADRVAEEGERIVQREAALRKHLAAGADFAEAVAMIKAQDQG
jgi:4-hydroxy-4-methyl-2-oxoglutarate aldolase